MSPPLPHSGPHAVVKRMIPRPYVAGNPSPILTVVFIAASWAGGSSLPPSSARQKCAMSDAVLTSAPAAQADEALRAVRSRSRPPTSPYPLA
jgi:hypothetical protein